MGWAEGEGGRDPTLQFLNSEKVPINSPSRVFNVTILSTEDLEAASMEQSQLNHDERAVVGPCSIPALDMSDLRLS